MYWNKGSDMSTRSRSGFHTWDEANGMFRFVGNPEAYQRDKYARNHEKRKGEAILSKQNDISSLEQDILKQRMVMAQINVQFHTSEWMLAHKIDFCRRELRQLKHIKEMQTKQENREGAVKWFEYYSKKKEDYKAILQNATASRHRNITRLEEEIKKRHERIEEIKMDIEEVRLNSPANIAFILKRQHQQNSAKGPPMQASV